MNNNGKPAATALFAVKQNLGIDRGGDFAYKRQPQAVALLLTGIFAAVEFLKHSAFIFLAYSAAVILYRYKDFLAVIFKFNRNFSAFRGEFKGVAYKVEPDMFQQLAVGGYKAFVGNITLYTNIFLIPHAFCGNNGKP